MLRTVVLALLAGCSFSAQVPGEEDVGADASTTHTTDPGRCKQAGLALCVDFEDMPTIKDDLGGAVTSQNVVQMLRTTVEHGADFNSTSRLVIADNRRLDITLNLTIEMWMKSGARPPDEDDKQWGMLDTERQYAMNYEHSGGIECMIGSDHLDSRTALSFDEWHHVACTYDGLEMRVYVDGRLDGCKLLTRTIPTDGNTGAAIGSNLMAGQIKNHFIGALDNVHLYAKKLAASEICTQWGGGGCYDSCI